VWLKSSENGTKSQSFSNLTGETVNFGELGPSVMWAAVVPKTARSSQTHRHSSPKNTLTNFESFRHPAGLIECQQST